MKKWLILLAIGFLLILLIGIFFFFVETAPSAPLKIVKNPAEGMTKEEAILEFREEYIDYLIFAIGGWKLHNPPLSEDTPKIKVTLGNETYVSEIIDTEIKTTKRNISNEDMEIATTKEVIVGILLADNMEEYARQSVENGEISFELKTSYSKLLSKGYLQLYESLTGNSLTGKIIRIFRS